MGRGYRMPPQVEERTITFDSSGGLHLQGKLHLPPAVRGGLVVCHPNPLQGGTMDNKVVTVTARAAAAASLATLRFNFRGVGRSQGRHQRGEAEGEDVRAALRRLDEELASSGLSSAVRLERLLAGFSFGSAMALRAVAAGERVDHLLLIAPPLATSMVEGPSLPADQVLTVIAGDRDEFCPIDEVRRFVEHHGDHGQLEVVADCGHCFHGRLDRLAALVAQAFAADR